jgi:hypothetical protein
MKIFNKNGIRSLVKLPLFFIVLLGLSCSNEDMSNMDGLEQQANRVRPISGEFFNFADPNQDPATLLECTPFGNDAVLPRNIIGGKMTHLGKLKTGSTDGSGTFGNPISCSINEAFTEIYSVYEVNYVAANGDEVLTVEDVTIIFNLDDPTFSTGTYEGTVEIVGGTGRFEGASGNMVFVGATFGPEGSNWQLVGEITY